MFNSDEEAAFTKISDPNIACFIMYVVPSALFDTLNELDCWTYDEESVDEESELDDGVPEEWTCNEAFYDARDGCDCECGAYDPDCSLYDYGGNWILYGCESMITSLENDSEGEGEGEGEEGSTNEWSHQRGHQRHQWNHQWQPASAGNGGAMCNSEGHCEMDPDYEEEGNVGRVPADWVCYSGYYDSNDGCDCNCGAPDPDCEDNYYGNYIYGCGTQDATCDAEGECEYEEGWEGYEEEGDYTWAPSNWYCSYYYYQCGYDEEGWSPNAEEEGGVCSAFYDLCGYDEEGWSPNSDADWSPNSDADSGAGVPEDWECSPYYYDTRDGCDCNCGALDPDCEYNDYTYGCGTPDATCDAEGQCVYDEEGRWYDTLSPNSDEEEDYEEAENEDDEVQDALEGLENEDDEVQDALEEEAKRSEFDDDPEEVLGLNPKTFIGVVIGVAVFVIFLAVAGQCAYHHHRNKSKATKANFPPSAVVVSTDEMDFGDLQKTKKKCLTKNAKTLWNDISM